LEVNTDKVDTEIPSPISGVILSTLVTEGDVVKVGALLGWIGQSGETIPPEGTPETPPGAQIPSSQPESTVVTPSPQLTAPRELGFISPVVAKIAVEQNVDLSKVTGTGMGGRITKKDIESYLENKLSAPSILPPAVQAAPPAPTSEIKILPASSASGDFTVRPQTAMRKAIAEHMLLSEHTAPHVSTIMEVDMSRVVAHRNATKESFSSEGVNLTFTAYFVLASVVALKAYPLVNSSWSEEGVKIYSAINIGMATALGDEGLIVPVIKHADNLSLSGVARTVNDLSNRARSHRLLPDK
jgi:2-oxoglutarate dehydrogenase E2 component (dihydrolipoamide succinyltransferase)